MDRQCGHYSQMVSFGRCEKENIKMIKVNRIWVIETKRNIKWEPISICYYTRQSARAIIQDIKNVKPYIQYRIVKYEAAE